MKKKGEGNENNDDDHRFHAADNQNQITTSNHVTLKSDSIITSELTSLSHLLVALKGIGSRSKRKLAVSFK